MFFRFRFIILIKYIFILIFHGIYADFNYIDNDVIDLVQEDKKGKFNHYRNRNDFFFILMSDKFDKDNEINFKFTNKTNNETIYFKFKEKYKDLVTNEDKYREKIYFEDLNGDLKLEQDLKDFTVVVFKVKLLNDTEKYIICNDCNSFVNKDREKPYGFFEYFEKIKEISVEYISNNKNKWNNAHTLFQECKNLEKIDFKDFEYNFKNISVMFDGCKNLKEIKNIKSIFKKSENIKDCDMLFLHCEKLEFDKIGFKNIKLPKDFDIFDSSLFKKIDLSSCDFSNVEKIGFRSCENLEEINLNITTNTSNLKNLNRAFFYCKKLKKIDLSKIKVENVTDFILIFAYCENLEEVNLAGWNFNEKVNLTNFFAECVNLKKIIGLKNIIVKNDLILSNGDKEINCGNFFYNNENLETLDLSTFKIEDCNEQFIQECNIKTIILPNDKKSIQILTEKCLNNKKSKNTIKNLKIGDYELNDINEYDDLLRFISDPKNYLHNKNKTNDEIKPKLENIKPLDDQDVKNIENIGFCSKCFSNCCCCKRNV